MALPSGLTTDSSDEVLMKVIQDLSADITRDPRINNVLNTVPVIQIYQNEMQRRLFEKMKILYQDNVKLIAELRGEVVDLKNVTSTSSRTATILAWVSTGIAFISVIITFFSIQLALKANQISEKNDKNSSEWQSEQLPLLQDISDKLLDLIELNRQDPRFK